MAGVAEICDRIGEIDGLAFRPWRIQDAPILLAAWLDEEIAAWNPIPPNPSIELAQRWIHSTYTQTASSRGIDVVAQRGEGIVGEVGLQVDRSQAVGELGLWVAADQRRTGIGRSLLTFAHRLALDLELRGLLAVVNPANAGAVGLFTAAGWTTIPTDEGPVTFASRVSG